MPCSLAGNEVKPDNLQDCHSLKKEETVIIKFKCRKYKWRVLVGRKNLQNKSEDLCQPKLSGKLFVSESMCHENHQLVYICHQLRKVGKINSYSLASLEECKLVRAFVQINL